ncbi:MAG: hypothetical protein FWC41_05070 [Firmicutes bacterium]|nr:hypothetical protein [Bacillota bacterium]
MKQNLKLDYIESGRMSDKEMSEIYGGWITCDIYTICHAVEKNSCHIYYNCQSESSYVYCTTRNWVASNNEVHEFVTIK